jgi:hypothetical protein
MDTRPNPREQQAVYQEMANALFVSVPNGWTRIRILIKVPSPDQPILEIAGPDHTPLLKTPEESLYSAVYRLIDLFRNTGSLFKEVDYKLDWDESSEDWKMTVDFKWE